MILIYFPQDIQLTYDDGNTRQFKGFQPRAEDGKTIWDLNRVYLTLEEHLISLTSESRRLGSPQPVQLSLDIFKLRFPSFELFILIFLEL